MRKNQEEKWELILDYHVGPRTVWSEGSVPRKEKVIQWTGEFCLKYEDRGSVSVL